MVVKNLLQKAFESLEGNYEELYPILKGNTAIMFSNAANAPAKLIDKYKADKVPAFKGAYGLESFFVGAPERRGWSTSRARQSLSAM